VRFGPLRLKAEEGDVGLDERVELPNARVLVEQVRTDIDL